jgi:hypothetical protein
MKGLAVIGLVLALGLSFSAVAQASSGPHHPAGKKKKHKKCKANWTFRKGKCRRVKGPPLAPVDNSPRDAVRATLTWQGNANLDLVVRDEQGRQAGGTDSAGSVVNEIPDATQTGDASSGGTETFVDHLWHPNPFLAPNRGFDFTSCARDVTGPNPVTATLTLLSAFGSTLTLHPQLGPTDGSGSTSTICLGYYA